MDPKSLEQAVRDQLISNNSGLASNGRDQTNTQATMPVPT